ncbi:MAG: L-lactate permease [Pseudomonadota bacterium]
MLIALAALPLACVLFAMVALHKSALVGSLLGLAAVGALTVGMARTFGLAANTSLPLADAAIGTVAEAGFSTLTIIWIIAPALALYTYQNRSGATERLRDALAGLTPHRRLQGLLIAWFFGLFMEGAAGFGTPVALAAPLLHGMGYSPVRAVTLALLGHAAGVSFGAVGTPTLAQLSLTDLTPANLAGTIALIQAIIGWVFLGATAYLASDAPFTRRDLTWTLFAGLTFFVPSVVFAWFTGPELPSLAGALVGGMIFVTALRRVAPQDNPTITELNYRALAADLAPYVIVVVLILLTRLVTPLQAALTGFSFDWQLHGLFQGAFAPAYHPGTLLWLGLGLGAMITNRLGTLPSAAGHALRLTIKVGVSLATMLMLSRLMVHTGMIGTLAEAAAETGPAWAMLSPWVGVLGTFITGSATTSNILFTELQLSAAQALGLPSGLMAASQGVGSAIGNVLAPHNIIAGAATVGLVSQEGKIMRTTMTWGAVSALLCGVIVTGISAWAR